MILSRIRKGFFKHKNNICPDDNLDIASVEIGDLKVTLARRLTLQVPHEFSVFIPRVEIREKRYHDGKLQFEKETIYSSLTIVHSPQRPPAQTSEPG